MNEGLDPEALMAAYEAQKAHAADPGRKGSGLEKAIKAYLSTRSPTIEPSGGTSDLVKRLSAGDTEYSDDEKSALGALAAHCINDSFVLTAKDAKLLLNILTRWEQQRREAASAITALERRFNFLAHLQRQREWSERTFGPGDRAKGVIDHIRKELAEIEADPRDLAEWIDVVILALDGAWRAGYTPDQILAQLITKQAKNEDRKWPDWRTMPSDKAIEHDRSAAE